MPYPGLPRESLTFLQGLAAHNERDWFEAHRADYENHWLQASLDLIAALAPYCEAMEPRLLAVPKLNQSLRRIHRDTRFSKDKTPYQPWLHVILSTGPAFNKAPGMHLVLTPEGLGYGAGQYGMDPAALDECASGSVTRVSVRVFWWRWTWLGRCKARSTRPNWRVCQRAMRRRRSGSTCCVAKA